MNSYRYSVVTVLSYAVTWCRDRYTIYQIIKSEKYLVILDLYASKYLASMVFERFNGYATSYATLLLHNERGKSRFHNELIPICTLSKSNFHARNSMS